MPGDKLRTVVPWAAASLAVGRAVNLSYSPGYYAKGLDTLMYSSSQVNFATHRQADGSESTEDLLVFGPDSTPPYQTDRQNDTRLPSQTPASIEDLYINFHNNVDALRLERVIGIDHMTATECQALFNIATHLDQLTTA